MDHVLIDTDVILDFFLDRAPYSEFASIVLNKCETKTIIGYTTPVIISNVYYLLRRTAKHTLIIEKLKLLLTVLEVVQMDKTTVLEALNSKFKDFEDALQNYSAEKHNNITIVLTRNIKDFKHSKLAVLSPETYLKGANT